MDLILDSLSLSSLKENFTRERLSLSGIRSLTDEELQRLGVATIGDRIRLKEACKQQQQQPLQLGRLDNTADARPSDSSTLTNGARETSVLPLTPRERVREHRNTLYSGQVQRQSFGQNNNRRNVRRARGFSSTKENKGRSWTVDLFCLSNKHAITVPNALEKMQLQKAGLGLKKGETLPW